MEIPRHWRLNAQRYRLQGSVCPICGQARFPPRPACPRCMLQVRSVADARVPLTSNSAFIAEFSGHVHHQVIESTIG